MDQHASAAGFGATVIIGLRVGTTGGGMHRGLFDAIRWLCQEAFLSNFDLSVGKENHRLP